MSSTFRVKNEIGDGLLRRKRASGEGSRHSRYAISGLLCPNFCVHLSAHPFANPGIPPARTTTITIGIPCHRLSFLKLASLTKPFSSYSLPLFRFLFPFAIFISAYPSFSSSLPDRNAFVFADCLAEVPSPIAISTNLSLKFFGKQ